MCGGAADRAGSMLVTPQSTHHRNWTSAMDNDHLLTLQNTIASTKTLLESFDKSLSDPSAANSTTPATSSSSLNPLALLSDASSILKAQTTKLSLLILNKPFTPSAITYILTSLSTSCLPALLSALELCPPATYSAFLHQHIRILLSRAFRALLALLATIPHDERSNAKLGDRDTLAATGQLWQTCDDMAKVASSGLSTLAIEKLDTYHSLLKDAIAELEEWDPDEDTETDSNPDSEHPPTPSSSTTRPPSQISHLLTLALRLLRHIRLLYPALRKRRIKPFPPLSLPSDSTAASPPTPSQIHSLDALLTSIGAFSSEADEIAGALYAGDEKEVLRRLNSLREQAYSCIQDVTDSWNGAKDEFSPWAQQWLEMTRAMNLNLNLNLDGDLEAMAMEPLAHIPHCKGSSSPALKTELPIR